MSDEELLKKLIVLKGVIVLPESSTTFQRSPRRFGTL